MAETATKTGTERIAAAFEAAREQGRAALMPYLMGAFPDTATAIAVAEAYADSGADLVELGIPFSDPLADGPVIHAAATAALDSGATLDSALAAGAAISGRIPVIAMCYSNMVLAIGAELFATKLEASGIAGAIVPDLPIEESEEIGAALEARGLALIPLIAPTTPAARRAAICARARGFVYVVSTTGTTGERASLPEALHDLVVSTKADSPVPVAVGFGISTPEQAAEVGEVADGIIIGTRLVRAVAEAADSESAAGEAGAYLAETRAALQR